MTAQISKNTFTFRPFAQEHGKRVVRYIERLNVNAIHYSKQSVNKSINFICADFYWLVFALSAKSWCMWSNNLSPELVLYCSHWLQCTRVWYMLHYTSTKLKKWDMIGISEKSFTYTDKSHHPADAKCFATPTRSCLG